MLYTPNILIVDDEPRMCDSLKILLSEHRCDIKTAYNGLEAMGCLGSIAFDLVLMDIVLPDIDGYQIMDFIGRECSDTLVIIITGNASVESAVKALRKGASDYIRKPFQPKELLTTVGNILDQRRLIKERKMAEEALAETNKFLKNILDSSSSISIISTDLEHNILFWNKGAEKMFGYKAEEMVGRQSIGILYPGEKEKKLIGTIRSKILRDKKGSSCEIREITKDGRKLWINMNLTPRFDEEGHVIGILGIGEDISGRKLAEEALHREKEKFRVMVEGSPLGVSFIGEKGNYKYVNPKFVEMFGYVLGDIPTGREWFEKAHPDREYRNQVISTWINDLKESGEGEARPRTFPVKCKDGSEKVVHFRPVTMETGDQMVVYEDITEKRHLENQLQQAQKMEAIGTLASGIAHEFNNALSVITGNIDLLEMDSPFDQDITKYTGTMKTSAHRMTRLTNQLLAYARGGKYRARTISLSDFVRDTLPLIKHTIDPSVRVDTDLAHDLLNVEADLHQMQMVLSAILKNASEATEGEGTIRISTTNKELDEGFAKDHPGFKPGPYVCLTIEDDGKGMEEETRRKIFDPFFTTNFKGRGLGMAAAYGIVKNHNGWIWVDSEPGEGTIVRIYLPVVVAKEKVEEMEIEKPRTGLVKGTGTILIIEDEEMVMNVSRAVLERLGYSVVEAKNGIEAVDIARTFNGDIDLALLDIKLPDMGGEKVYPIIKGIRPNLKVIICSGYALDGPVQGILDAGAEGFVQKPFSIGTLSKKLKEVLEDE